MTSMNGHLIKRANASGSRITLMLLVLSVTLPALCVVWLLIRASENEELAYRQALRESHSRELSLLSSQLNLLANAKLQEIRQWYERPDATLSNIVENGIAQSITRAISTKAISSAEGSPEGGALSQDIRYLFQTFGPTVAYGRIIEWWQSGALKDHILKGERPLEPAFLLLALEYGQADQPDRSAVESALMEWIDRLHDPMPAGQLRFVLSHLQHHSSNPQKVATLLSSARLADRWASLIENSHTDPWTGFFVVDDLAAVSLGTDGTVALIHCDTLADHLVNALPQESRPSGRIIRLIPPGNPDTKAAPETGSLGFPLDGWRIELQSAASESPDSDRRPVLLYIWVGIWVILLSSILVSLVIAMVRKQVNKAAFRNDLVATVSHELKTPIASVRLLVDTLLTQEKSPDPDQVRDYLTLIQNENHRLGTLVEKFLTFSRMERNRITFDSHPTVVQDLLEESAQSFRERFSRQDYTLSIECQKPSTVLVVDRASMLTAIGNLLENAYKYTGSDKEIVLKAYTIPRFMVFEVADNGPGIPKNEVGRVFQKFYQPDRKLNSHRGGVGLGLSIVTFVARRHKGKVKLISEPGNGCRFQILIPHANHPHC